MRKNIGLRLSQARKAKGLTQEQLASASEEEQKVCLEIIKQVHKLSDKNITAELLPHNFLFVWKTDIINLKYKSAD